MVRARSSVVAAMTPVCPSPRTQPDDIRSGRRHTCEMADTGSSGFVPSQDAFAFTNSWPSAPAVTVQTPFGQVGIGNADNGLCGGMVFAALDYWHAGKTPQAARP